MGKHPVRFLEFFHQINEQWSLYSHCQPRKNAGFLLLVSRTSDPVHVPPQAVQMMRQAARLKLWHRCCGPVAQFFFTTTGPSMVPYKNGRYNGRYWDVEDGMGWSSTSRYNGPWYHGLYWMAYQEWWNTVKCQTNCVLPVCIINIHDVHTWGTMLLQSDFRFPLQRHWSSWQRGRRKGASFSSQIDLSEDGNGNVSTIFSTINVWCLKTLKVCLQLAVAFLNSIPPPRVIFTIKTWHECVWR